jgi:hypothetical protein
VPHYSRLPLLLLAALIACGLSACAAVEERLPEGQPVFYRSLVPPGSEVDSAVAASMFSGYRANHGLGPLAVDPVLTRIAKEHAVAMAARRTVGHDVGNGNLDQRARRAGYDYARINENIAGGYHTLAEAFSGWRDSPDHKKNMLMRDATHMGIAVAQAPGYKYKVFWAMVVARPDDKKTVVLSGPGTGPYPNPLQ